MARPLLIALTAIILAGSAGAQEGAVVSLVSDKEVYEYGESIELRYIVENQGDTAFSWWGNLGCFVSFTWDTFVSPGATGVCTGMDVEYHFAPGSTFSFIWTIVPAQHAAPASDGLHEVFAGRANGEHVTSTIFEAPLYLGGRVGVHLAQGVTIGDVADVMEDLNATIVESWGSTYIWEIEGTTVPDAIDQYADDPRFKGFYLDQEIYYIMYPVSVEPGGEIADAGLSAPFPNPATSAARLELLPPSAGPVTVDLLDLQGRRLARLHDEPLQAGQVVTITLYTHDIAAGSYVIRATGNDFTFSRSLTIVR